MGEVRQAVTAQAVPLPTCLRCGRPFDHGCNSAFCGRTCEELGVVVAESIGCPGDWTGTKGCGACAVSRADHWFADPEAEHAEQLRADGSLTLARVKPLPAETYAKALVANTDDFHEGRVSWEHFASNNRLIWDSIAKAHLTDRVLFLVGF